MNDQPASTSSTEASPPLPQSFQAPVAAPASLGGALVAGFLAALAGAAIWAIVTDITKFQIGWMAVGVGVLVGFAVRKFGRGTTPVFGFIGALFALLGCLAGNFFAIVGLASIESGTGFLELLGSIPLSVYPQIMTDSFAPMDLLFYGIAVYEGFKFATSQPRSA